jgi:hypothetical protein
VGTLNVLLLAVVLVLNDVNITLKLLVEATKTGLLESDQVVNVDKMVSESHLVLFLSFVQVAIKHLKNGILGVNFTIVVLLENLDFLLELLGFGETEDLTPMGHSFHSVEMRHFLFLNHASAQGFTTHFHEFGFLVKIFHGLVLVAVADLGALEFVGLGCTALDILS